MNDVAQPPRRILLTDPDPSEAKTDIVFILDRSGSMESVRLDTIGGLNSFIRSQRDLPGRATFTLAQFDNEYELVHSGIPIERVPEFTQQSFVPRGTTAMWDAIGRTLRDTEQRLAGLPDEEKPHRVLVVIITDGHENASREFRCAQVKEMIQGHTDRDGWQFVYLGANQDALQEGGELGVRAWNSMSYSASSEGVSHAYSCLCASVGNIRSSNLDSAPAAFFSDEQRQVQNDLITSGNTQTGPPTGITTTGGGTYPVSNTIHGNPVSPTPPDYLTSWTTNTNGTAPENS